jgi:hypothetical protein
VIARHRLPEEIVAGVGAACAVTRPARWPVLARTRIILRFMIPEARGLVAESRPNVREITERVYRFLVEKQGCVPYVKTMAR